MPFRIAFVQFEPTLRDVESNIRTIQNLLHDVRADLVVLPEMSNTGYLFSSCDDLRPWAEPGEINSPFLSSIKELASNTGGVIVTGYSERDGDRLFNSAAAISSDKIVANYRKTHLFSNEKDLFHPGDSGFVTFSWQGVIIGLMICFDWIFPESSRTLALAGAQIIAHPANLVLPYCQDAMITRSIENRVFTITANRIGTESLGDTSLTFTGMSQITAPDGALLYRAKKDETIVATVEIDPNLALNKNITEKNHLFSDRHPEYYTL